MNGVAPGFRVQGIGEFRRVTSIERRKHPRYSCSASAEAVELQSGARVQGRLSDLGRGGCYIDLMSPFGVNSDVRVRIEGSGRAFVAEAKVVFSTASMGMGLMFTSIEPEQLVVLEEWLAELSGEGPTQALSAEKRNGNQKAQSG